MANTTLTQTGAQVQSILDKADKLPATVGTNGQVLTSDGTNLSWTTPQTPQGGGTQLYRHFVTLLGDDESDFNNTKLIVITNSSSQLAFDENWIISSNGNIISAHCDSISSKTSEGVHSYLPLVVGMYLQDEVIDGLICQDQSDNSIQTISIGRPNFSTLTDVVTAL